MKRRETFTTFTTKLFLATTFSLLLAGCQTLQLPGSSNFQTQPGPAMPAANLPAVQVGDKYYYTDGSREQVVSVDGEVVNMTSASGRKLSNFRNFALPQPYLEGATKEYLKRSNTTATVLWPLSVGASARFTTEGRTRTKDTGEVTEYTQKWECNVDGTEHVRVLAGEFDTFRVVCKRYSTTGKFWQSRTWYYAPALGSYVLRRDFVKGGGERIRELTAVRPSLQDLPDKVRQNVIHAWQTALESKQAGEAVIWTDKKSGVSVQVEPLQTYRAQNGQFCRTYKELLTRQKTTGVYMGVACRTGKMKWRTPTQG